MQWTGKENATGDSSLPKASEKEFLSNLVACSMRSDSGVRREGRERKKNKEKNRERESIFPTRGRDSAYERGGDARRLA